MKKITLYITVLLISFLSLTNAQVSNGDFEAGEISPWGGFKNGIVGSATTTPYLGESCGRIESHDGSLFQDVVVEVGKAYMLTFYAKWSESSSSSFNFVIKEGSTKLINQAIVANETGWTENTVSFTPSQTNIRLLWYKGKVTPRYPAFYLDEVSIGTATNVDSNLNNTSSAYPNPTNNKCTIHPQGKVKSYKLYNTSGTLLLNKSVGVNNCFTINLKGFNKGIYLLKLSNGEVIKINKN